MQKHQTKEINHFEETQRERGNKPLELVKIKESYLTLVAKQAATAFLK